MFYKEALIKSGGYNELFKHSEDYELFWRLCRLGIISNLDEIHHNQWIEACKAGYDSKEYNKLTSPFEYAGPFTETVLIGNIPDKDRAQNFYYDNIDYEDLLNDNTTNIGKWWSVSDFKEMAELNNYKFDFYNMPNKFYAAHYRYDVVLS